MMSMVWVGLGRRGEDLVDGELLPLRVRPLDLELRAYIRGNLCHSAALTFVYIANIHIKRTRQGRRMEIPRIELRAVPLHPALRAAHRPAALAHPRRHPVAALA
jgi:hypothetical protein